MLHNCYIINDSRLVLPGYEPGGWGFESSRAYLLKIPSIVFFVHTLKSAFSNYPFGLFKDDTLKLIIFNFELIIVILKLTPT